MKTRTFLAAALLGTLSIPVLPLAAKACWKYNPFCRNPIIRDKVVKPIDKAWVKTRDKVTDQFSGHICKQIVLSAKRRSGYSGTLRATKSRYGKMRRWLDASGVFRDINLDRVKIRFVDLTNASGLTHGHTIYIDTKSFLKYYKKSDTALLLLIAHELGHVPQYKRYGTLEKFCRAYAKNVASHGNFSDMHRLGSMETEAGRAEYTMARWLRSAGLNAMGRQYGVRIRSFRISFGRNRSGIVDLPNGLPTVARWQRWRADQLGNIQGDNNQSPAVPRFTFH